MSETLNRITTLLAQAGTLQCAQVINGREAADARVMDRMKDRMAHMMGHEIADKMLADGWMERFINDPRASSFPYDEPASVEYTASVVVMTVPQYHELTRCIRTLQKLLNKAGPFNAIL